MRHHVINPVYLWEVAKHWCSVLAQKVLLPTLFTVKPVLSGHSKRRPKLVFKTNYPLMQVKSIAECSRKAFCNTFDLH